ncbi:MAG TPA: FG-GAP-like repeat-containing protein [Terriglobia bacterium]|nr:FG-GAP-like repeat-containing protein [Terriglobia bacterium]
MKNQFFKKFKFDHFAVFLLVFLLGAGSLSAQAWKFGVMDDTQWTAPTDPAGQNPNAVAVSIIDQLNREFVKQKVKFVIQVGDLTENGNDLDIATRALIAKPLTDNGIGFFPMRGNHETYANPANSFGIPAVQFYFPQTRGITNTFGATNFSSPTSVSADLDGMTYSFDYGPAGSNARFVILDNWVTPSKNVAPGNGYNYGYSFGDQQSWISGQLDKNTRGTTHAFVFSHQPLIAENHQDSPFVGYTDANPAMQNAFFASLQNNDVKYYISGHDHMQQRSIVVSPDGLSKVQEIIGASDSSKFYTPKAVTDAKWYNQKVRETSVFQELYTVGYYIYTVDGPRVTVEYYADDHGNWQSDANYPNGPSLVDTGITPPFNFVKKATWGYSLNGKEFLVGGTNPTSYTVVQDTFGSTFAQILSGSYTNTAKDFNNRVFTQTVNTGWTPGPAGCPSSYVGNVNDVLSLWGMSNSGNRQTDTYALSMTYNSHCSWPGQLSGSFGLGTQDSIGNWVNAVDRNVGGTKQFVLGPWQSSYGLGTYGVDTSSHTVWAVINYEGNFAAAGFSPALIGSDFNGDGKADIFWRNPSTGQNTTWIQGGGGYFFPDMDTNWRAAAFGDFNGDGWTDVVWQNDSDQTVMVWYMNGQAAPLGADYMLNMGPDWKVVAAGDFNRDGKADLFWRNESTGSTVVWVMDGITFKYALWLAPLDSDWRLACVTDIGPDGRLDLIWQRKTGDGAVMIWTMWDSSSSPIAVSYWPCPAPEWKIVGSGDFNGDGKTDILWHSSSTGDVSVWLLNGWSLLDHPVLGNAPTDWKAFGEEY